MARQIYYPIRRNEAQARLHRTFYFQTRQTRLRRGTFKGNYVAVETQRNAGSKRRHHEGERRFWFRFTCKPVYRVVRLRMEVLLTSIVVHCTSMCTMRMQKCSLEVHLRCVLSLRRSFWKLPVETFGRMFTQSYAKYATFLAWP